MSRWWRAYDDALDDPKLQKLSADMFKAWFNLLCLASRNDGLIPCIADVAFALRMSEKEAGARLAHLQVVGLIDVDSETGVSSPHNWNGRQFKHDVSTERVKRFRERHETVSETPGETPPDTETEHRRKETATQSPKERRGTRLPVGWIPRLDDGSSAILSPFEKSELAKFIDYWRARAGPGAIKLDWDATWRNWMRTANERRKPEQQRDTVQAAARRLAESVIDFGPIPQRPVFGGSGDTSSRDPPRQLSQRGRSRPGDLRSGDSVGTGVLSDVGGLPGDGPTFRPSGYEPMASDRGGSEVVLRAGDGPDAGGEAPRGNAVRDGFRS